MTSSPKTEICDAIHAHKRFLITSHARPDGDSIGSQLAMYYALEALGKEARIVNADPAPDHYMEFPGVDRIEVARAVVEQDADALIVMESRPGATGAGAGQRFTINIDHHQGTPSTARSSAGSVGRPRGEMVFDLIACSACR
jgi:phosphoesterase RecJ-like protein